jgi:hypothetical protein
MRVVYANAYVGNRTPRRARRRMFDGKPDAVISVESRWLVKAAARLRGYRATVARGGEPKGRTDVIVWVRREHAYLGEIVVQTSPTLRRFPFAHTRYVVASLAQVKGVGKVAFIGWHPTPGPKVLDHAPDLDHPIALAYADALDELLAVVRLCKRLGFEAVLGADTQVRSNSTSPLAPIPRLRRSGVEVTVAEGIDLLAASRGLVVTASGVHSTPAESGSDHPWLHAAYR